MGKVVEGRTVCPVCKTDKSWTIVNDALTSEEEKRDLTDTDMETRSIKMQFDSIASAHDGHISKATRQYRLHGAGWMEYKD